MSSKWFVVPAVTRLDLGDGAWVDVKNELTVKESSAMQAALIKSVEASGKVEPDFTQVWKAATVAYIVDWHLPQADGRAVPYTPAAVDNMTKHGWEALQGAVQAHIEAQEAQREGKSIGSMSRPDSPSAE